tara:strand:- start:551 stop:1315 length:765 start_codon:yes stop_codon:yes gene_type:complete
MARHRGKYNPDNSVAYEVSRSKIENFIKCPACFYLDRVKGVKFPPIFGYNINEATDVLLKKEFDKYREKQESHPFLIKKSLSHLIPFQHDDFELWTKSLQLGLRTYHEETNLIIGGGLDDVWFNKKNNKLHIVDYKSTSVKTEGKGIDMNDQWKGSYKRQMDVYIWILKKNGFDVSDTGYFLYCDGDRFTEEPFLNEKDARMIFKMYLFEYESDQNWVDTAIKNIKKLLDNSVCPDHSQGCEYGLFLDMVNQNS